MGTVIEFKNFGKVKNAECETTSGPTLNLCFYVIWWYRFQNSSTIADRGLKFSMAIEFVKLEDRMQVFLTGSVHK